MKLKVFALEHQLTALRSSLPEEVVDDITEQDLEAAEQELETEGADEDLADRAARELLTGVVGTGGLGELLARKGRGPRGAGAPSGSNGRSGSKGRRSTSLPSSPVRPRSGRPRGKSIDHSYPPPASGGSVGGGGGGGGGAGTATRRSTPSSSHSSEDSSAPPDASVNSPIVVRHAVMGPHSTALTSASPARLPLLVRGSTSLDSTVGVSSRRQVPPELGGNSPLFYAGPLGNSFSLGDLPPAAAVASLPPTSSGALSSFAGPTSGWGVVGNGGGPASAMHANGFAPGSFRANSGFKANRRRGVSEDVQGMRRLLESVEQQQPTSARVSKKRPRTESVPIVLPSEASPEDLLALQGRDSDVVTAALALFECAAGGART